MPSLFVILGIKINKHKSRGVVKFCKKKIPKKKAELARLGEHPLQGNIKRRQGWSFLHPKTAPQHSKMWELTAVHDFVSPKPPFWCFASILVFLFTPYK